MFASARMRDALVWFIAIGIAAIAIVTAPAVNQKKTEEVCVGHCPPPGPLDCTIYGRKKDGSWPSGFECSSTP